MQISKQFHRVFSLFSPLFFSVFFIIFCVKTNIYAQIEYVSLGDAPKKVLQYYENGQYNFEHHEFEKAEKNWLKAVALEPRFIDAHFGLAEMYFQEKNYAAARTHYKRCAQLSRMYKPQSLFTLGLIAEIEQNWAEAADEYEAFLALRRDAELVKQAQKRAAYCRFRAKAYANPVPFSPKNLGKNINSADAEYLPSLTIDGKTLIFTANKNGTNEDFYRAKRTADGTWLPAENMGAPLNTPQNEGAQNIAANGKSIVFSACDRPEGLGGCDIYLSEYENGAWSKPKNMGAPINTAKWEAHASLTADGNTLYFSSNRKHAEAQGDDDIFVANRLADGTWSAPTPLPAPINTPLAERAPFIHADGKTLYFSSNGHAGFGKSDIFVSHKNNAGVWSEPLNLGFPINTAQTDWSLIVASDGKTAFYAAERPDGEGNTDLYTFTLPENTRATPTTFILGLVKDNETKEIVTGANCKLIDLSTQTVLLNQKNDSDGRFLVPLPSGKQYALYIEHPNYMFFSDNFALDGEINTEKPFEKIVFLQKIQTKNKDNSKLETPKKHTAIILKNVFFDTNSSELLPASAYELQQLFDLLTQNPTMRIQLNGHTDSQGDDASNQSLSERRANAVSSYLSEKGIEKERLSAKGYGETLPIDANTSAEGRANNRRTEFIIIE